MDETTEIEAPETDAPEVEETVLDGEVEETEVTEAVEVDDDPFSPFGGRETIERAHKLYEASRTHEGVTQLFLEAGVALGLSEAQIKALFGAEDEGTTTEDEDEDRVLTAREVKEMLARERQADEAKRSASQATAAKAALDATLNELGLKADDPALDVIYKLGDKHLNGNYSPENVANAMRKGHADYLVLIQKEHDRYIAKKTQQRKTAPKVPSGNAAPSAPILPEPKNVAEAIARRNAQRRAR